MRNHSKSTIDRHDTLRALTAEFIAETAISVPLSLTEDEVEKSQGD